MAGRNTDEVLGSLTVSEIWHRLIEAIRPEAPWVCDSLNPPATEEALNEFEAVLGKPLPVDFRSLYATSDGSRPTPAHQLRARNFLDSMDFIPLCRIRNSWEEECTMSLPGTCEPEDEIECRVVGPVRPRMRLRNLLPLCRRENQQMYLDLDPAPGGTCGQMVLYLYDTVTGVMVAPSLRDWLLGEMIRWEQGAYAYCSNYGLTTIDHVIDDMENKGVTDENRDRHRTLKARYESLMKRIGRI